MSGHTTTEHHDDASHGPAPTPPTLPALPAHAIAIARGTHWLGLALWAGAFLAAWPLLWTRGTIPFALCALVSLYGFCVWLAARDTLAQER